MKRIFIKYIVLLTYFCVSALGLEAQNAAEISEKAQKYMTEIEAMLDSSPEAEGITQQEYDQELGVKYYYLSLEHFRYFMLEDALSAAQSSADYFERAGNGAYQMEALQMVADVSFYSDKYQVAMDALAEALAIAKENESDDYSVGILLQTYKMAERQNDREKIQEIVRLLQSVNAESLNRSARLDLIKHYFDYSLSTGDLDMAFMYLEEYRTAMQDETEDSSEFDIFYQYEGRYYAKIGAYADAAASYERMLDPAKPFETQVSLLLMVLYNYACAADDVNFDKYLEKINTVKDSPSLSIRMWVDIHSHIIVSANRLERYELAVKTAQEVEARGIRSLSVMTGKGGALYQLGRYEESRDACMEYMEACRESYGEESLKYADALRILANVEGFCGDVKSGSEHLIKSLRLVQSIVRREMPYVPFDRLENFWDDVSTNINAMAGYYIKAGLTPGEFSVAAYEGLVLAKGLLLASETSFADYVESSGNDDLRNLYAEILSLREKMEGLKKSYTQNKEAIQILQPELVLKESQLMNYGSGWSGYTSHLDVTYDQLNSKLKDNELVIDFVDYTLDTGVRKYAAFVYRRGWDAPVIVPLCTQAELDSFEAFRIRPDAIYGRKASTFFLDLLWKPLESYVRDGDVVYMIPSGDLHLISFDSFQQRDRSLLGSRYDFIRLSSARELIEGGSESGSASDAVLYGGLQYDMTGDDRMAEAGKHTLRMSRAVSRSVRGSGERFVDLPMSGKEVASVSELLDGSGVRVKCYVGKEGTEESFMSLSAPSPDILHFATHGFYYTPEDAAQVSGLSGYKSAMRLSGLVLAGGNAEWMGEEIPKNTLGGILTADDIAQCDLSGTGLVVLTACDTGKGKVTSEGIYGLQRAFKKAGADTILMSLWKVDDKAATEFIGIFYESLTSNGWNKRAALKSAKDKMRHKYPSPYYWAGFVMLD